MDELKRYLSHPPVLSLPKKEEVLYACIAVTCHAVSLVLVKTEDRVQRPIYYIKKSLQEAEIRYLPLEKAVLASTHAIRKLPHYFQVHTMVVLTQLPLQALLQKSNYVGMIAKLGTMLRAFDIKYMPRTAIKGQVLADSVAKFTEEFVEDKVLGSKIMVISTPSFLAWEVYTDGATNQKSSSMGIVLISP